MIKKTLLLIIAALILIVPAAYCNNRWDSVAYSDNPEIFEEHYQRAVAYIVERLVAAIAEDADIVVTFMGANDMMRVSDRIVDHALGMYLGLGGCRFLEIPKGKSNLKFYDYVCVYEPQPCHKQNVSWNMDSRPYRPFTANLGYVWLIFVRRVYEPLENYRMVLRTDSGNEVDEEEEDDEWSNTEDDERSKAYAQLEADAQTLTTEEFLRKHGLMEIFRDRVYQEIEGCAFTVDYPIPYISVEGEGNPTLLPDTEENREKRRTMGRSNAINLSRREASEVVYIAHKAGGRSATAAADYAAAASSSHLLLPLPEPVEFETAIGKALFEAVKAAKAKPDAQD